MPGASRRPEVVAGGARKVAERPSRPVAEGILIRTLNGSGPSVGGPGGRTARGPPRSFFQPCRETSRAVDAVRGPAFPGPSRPSPPVGPATMANLRSASCPETPPRSRRRVGRSARGGAAASGGRWVEKRPDPAGLGGARGPDRGGSSATVAARPQRTPPTPAAMRVRAFPETSSARVVAPDLDSCRTTREPHGKVVCGASTRLGKSRHRPAPPDASRRRLVRRANDRQASGNDGRRPPRRHRRRSFGSRTVGVGRHVSENERCDLARVRRPTAARSGRQTGRRGDDPPPKPS